MKNEIWKTIEKYPDYEISNFGRIKSYKRNKIRFVVGGRDKDGYHIVGLTRNKKRKTERVHRLVLETFVGIDPDKPFCNHKNGIKTDNRLENLEWCTQSENEKHAHKLGLKNFKGNKVFSRGCGEDNPFYGRCHSEGTKRKQSEIMKNISSRWWEIIKPNGDVIKIRNLKQFCRENNFGYSNIKDRCRNNKKFKGYLFRKVNENE